jgi:anti-sigma B factor antagonist
MRSRPRSVTVTHLPEAMHVSQGRYLLTALKSCMNTDRPCLVLDCSELFQMDSLTLHVLLCCLEEAIRRDGDVKLVAVTASVRETLERSRVGSLFEMYETETDAVNSVLQPHCLLMPYAHESGASVQITESAA